VKKKTVTFYLSYECDAADALQYLCVKKLLNLQENMKMKEKTGKTEKRTW
jgi:hypothetical protein